MINLCAYFTGIPYIQIEICGHRQIIIISSAALDSIAKIFTLLSIVPSFAAILSFLQDMWIYFAYNLARWIAFCYWDDLNRIYHLFISFSLGFLSQRLEMDQSSLLPIISYTYSICLEFLPNKRNKMKMKSKKCQKGAIEEC